MRVVGICGSLRAGSFNRALLAAAAAELPAGVEFRRVERARDATRLRRGRRRPVRRAGRRPAAAHARGSRRGRDRDAGVQRLDPGCAQERARLGLAALPGQLPARQAGRRDRRQHRHVRRRLGPGRAAQGAEHDRRGRARLGGSRCRPLTPRSRRTAGFAIPRWRRRSERSCTTWSSADAARSPRD